MRINLVRKYFDGIIIGFGILTVFLSFLLLAYAGWHPASQIISGVFKGNYTFNGSVNFSKGLTAKSINTTNLTTNFIKIIPVKNFSQIVNYNVSKGAALFYYPGNSSFVNSCDPFHDGSGVALWKLDGNAVDACGRYNGTWSGIESYGEGEFGEAASFDGSSYIDLGDVLDSLFTTNNYTISVWYKFTRYTDNSGYPSMLIDKWDTSGNSDNAFVLYPFMFIGGNNVAAKGQNLSLNKWHNIVGVLYPNGTIILYQDGKKAGVADDAKSFSTNYHLVIGGFTRNNYYYVVNGLIDQVRIFNRALTPEEVKELYNEKLKGLFMKTPDGKIERISN